MDGYQLWADSYDRDPNPLIALEWRKMTGLLKGLRPAHVLDVGCGTGRWLQYFRQSNTAATGVDLSSEMLKQAGNSYHLTGRLVLGDVSQLPIRSSCVDLVLCSLALGYFSDLPQTFREFARVASPGTRIAVSDLHPDAIDAGWSRSFRIGSARYAIEHYCHSLTAIKAAACQAGLQLRQCEAACFEAPELPLFQAAGKLGVFSRVKAIPALFLGLWEKPC